MVSHSHSVSPLGLALTRSKPRYLFRVDEIRKTPNAPQTYDSSGHHGIPAFEAGAVKRVMEGVTGMWWYCDGTQIREIGQLPQDAQLYITYSVFYIGGFGFWVLKGDATISDTYRHSNTWQPLYFRHFSQYSYLCNAGQHRTVASRRSNQNWLRLLPDIYYESAPVSNSPGYGGLAGELGIFLALIAFTIRPQDLRTGLPQMFRDGNWEAPGAFSHGRQSERGVVVHVLTCQSTTAEELHAYEQGHSARYYY
ncbi:hypothetical protein COCMIDRAFT_35636 [Bipolaris oryzae ATCC 44560]|uniref:Uncharacterized protein n=1 Tax=Bipolaris oryzae ATCC 44560 TaxID=930090 RepID=W6ZH78_COCMI|nr:uncharacterized protein COCMIDRAFT_35636 [Bipolaris oryzae ATCC 44560]EUC46769.1 hypothetical protein COCMIDRAFT_35636 [Bipolaris oryzae ATCC 44560]